MTSLTLESMSAGSDFLDTTDPASPRRRSVATAADALVPVAVVVAQILLDAPSSALRWSLWGVLVAWLAVLVVTEGVTGRTPGKAVSGLRSVDARTGRVIGLGAAAARTPVKLVLGVGTLAIAGLSYRWDPAGQERTWWDRIAGSRVIDAGVQVPGGTGRDRGLAPGTVDAVAARWAPVADNAPVVTNVPGRLWVGSPAAGPYRSPSRSTAPRQPAVPPAFSPAPARPPQPAAPSAAAPSPAAPSRSTRPRHAAPDTALPSGGPGPAQPDRTDAIAVGWGHPAVPPGPPGVVDDPAAETLGSTGLHDPTRVHTRDELGTVPPRVPGRPTTATLQWDTGARVVVGGTVLIGRDPVSDDGEKIDRRLAVGHGSVGVSKTHLLLSITTAGVTVTDRHSTNGVRLEHENGTSEKCRPDVATAVRDGDVIRFGGRSITLPAD